MCVAKSTLLASDIVERGQERLCNTIHFHLHPVTFTELHKTVYEFQFYWERAAGLIRNRNRHCIIDPKDVFMTLLNRTYNLVQIHTAWLGVMTQLHLGLKFMDTYKEEYKGTAEEAPLSPISTLLEISSELDRISNPNECMSSVCRSSSLDWKKDWYRTEPNCKRPDHRLRLRKFWIFRLPVVMFVEKSKNRKKPV